MKLFKLVPTITYRRILVTLVMVLCLTLATLFTFGEFHNLVLESFFKVTGLFLYAIAIAIAKGLELIK